MNAPAPIDPSLSMGAARLAVGELSRSADFYERVLGLPLISRAPGAGGADSARLGVDHEHPALELVQIAEPTAIVPHSTGLFHVAWLHPSRAALADTVQRIASERWPIDGAADHGVSEALYLSDPDGLGIEIYVDRPREQWRRPPGGQGVEMVSLALDIDDLMAQALGAPSAAMAPGSGIGHVHMKVADVSRAASFYRDALGLDEQATMPSAAFLSAGGYHHHIGLNSWQSRGMEAPPDSAPGLREVRFELTDAAAVQALEQRLAERSGVEPIERSDEQGVSLLDADGQRLSFRPRGA